MKKTTFTILFILLLCSFAFAQTEKNNDSICPDITLIEPPSPVSPGEEVKFILQGLNEKGEKYPTIKWSLDKGSIISGIGTSTIGVSTSGVANETINITAKVETSENCSSTLFGTAETISGDSLQLDEFRKINNTELKKRLSVPFKELNNPQLHGYIINYGTEDEVAERESLLRSLIIKNKFYHDRIIFVNGGEAKEILTKIWLVPNTCPTVAIVGPPTMSAGETITFTLEIDGKYDKDKVKIDWTTDGGDIVGGQGTKSLKVLTYKKYEDEMLVKATATITGFPEGCSDIKISEAGICSHCGDVGTKPFIVDEITESKVKDMNNKLDAYLVRLRETSNSAAFIKIYGSEKDYIKYKTKLYNYFKSQKFDLSEVVIRDGGNEKDLLIKLWIIPAGADVSDID